MRVTGKIKIARVLIISIISLCLVLQGTLPSLWGDSYDAGIQNVDAVTSDVWDGVDSIPVDDSHFYSAEFEEYVRDLFGDELTKEEALSLTDIETNAYVYDLSQLLYFPSLQTITLTNYNDGASYLEFSTFHDLRYIHLSTPYSHKWDDFEFEESINRYDPFFDFSSNSYLTTIEFDNIDVRAIRTGESLRFISVNNCLNLNSIECERSKINSIDLSGAPNLEKLNLRYTSIKKLDLSHNPLLKQVYLAGTGIKTLDLTRAKKLMKLDVSDASNLTTLDISANQELTNLNVMSTSITSLDLSDKTKLSTIDIGDDKLACLDLSNTSIYYYGREWNGSPGYDGYGFYHSGDHATIATADENGIVDLRKIDPNFDYSKVIFTSYDYDHQDCSITVTEDGFKISGTIPDGFTYKYDMGLYYNWDEDYNELYHDPNATDYYLEPFPFRGAVKLTNAGDIHVDPEEIPDARLYEDVPGLVNNSGLLSFDFDENDFADQPDIYDHTMGRAAVSLSLLAYNDNYLHLKEVVEDIGFSDVHTWNKDMVDDTEKGLYSPYMVAHKKVLLEGVPTELMIVAIRGTYQMEWMDDFDSGTGRVHEGFDRAKSFILEDLDDYIQDSSIDTSCPIKMLVTGHSRGAAVSNLIGKELDDGYFNNYGISEDDVFVYTFATPNPAVIDSSEKNKYNNIFNIVNPEDFVTKVIPAAWGYGRYGRTYVLPSKTTEKVSSTAHYVDYTKYLQGIKDWYTKLDGKNMYVPYDHGERDLANYITSVVRSVDTVEKYYHKNLMTGLNETKPSKSSLHDLYKYGLGGHESKKEKYEIQSLLYLGAAAKLQFGEVGFRTISYFLQNQVDLINNVDWFEPRFATAHMCETYYAGMMLLSQAELLQKRHVICGEANCPVDVTIKNSDGSIAGQIVNNEIVADAADENSGVTMTVEGESKQFSIPAGGEFNIEITGNDTGTMDYTLREEDADTGEVQRVYYQSVPVTPSTTLTQCIAEEQELTTIELVDEAGQVIEPEAVIENNGIGDLSVEVTVEGNGSAFGMSNLKPGDYVTLTAIPEEGNEFAGWFDSEGQLVSSDKEYGISMKESITLTAKFTEIVDPCANGHSWEEVEYVWADDNLSCTATTVCKNDSSHILTETVSTTAKVTKPATYTTRGETTYTAAFTNKAFWSQTKTVANIPVLAKKANPITVKAKAVKVKYKSLKKKTQIIAATKAFAVSKAQGKVTYKVVTFDKKAKKKINVNSAGKVTVKKGLKKGTYKIKVQVTAAGSTAYKAGSKTVTLTIKIK